MQGRQALQQWQKLLEGEGVEEAEEHNEQKEKG